MVRIVLLLFYFPLARRTLLVLAISVDPRTFWLLLYCSDFYTDRGGGRRESGILCRPYADSTHPVIFSPRTLCLVAAVSNRVSQTVSLLCSTLLFLYPISDFEPFQFSLAHFLLFLSLSPSSLYYTSRGTFDSWTANHPANVQRHFTDWFLSAVALSVPSRVQSSTPTLYFKR